MRKVTFDGLKETMKKYKLPIIGAASGVAASAAIYIATGDTAYLVKLTYMLMEKMANIGNPCYSASPEFCFFPEIAEYTARVAGAVLPPAVGCAAGDLARIRKDSRE